MNNLVGKIESNELNINVELIEGGISGPEGPPGEDGYTPVKGVDYFDGEKGDTGEQGIQGLPGLDGEEGSQGEQGEIGLTGATGKSIEYSWNGTELGVRVEGENSYQYVNLKGGKGEQGIQGFTGKNLEFNWDGTQLGIRQEGQTSYTYVDLKGTKGDVGNTGATGKSMEFNWNGTNLGVRQEGETNYLYVDLKGEKGDTGEVTQEEFDGLEQDFNQHKLDYVEQRQQDNLKVAKVEKDINDYKSTMASVNVNQEAKQKVTGYGIVSLPKNSANGQVSVSVMGNSINQLVKNGNSVNTTDFFPYNGTITASNNTLIATSARVDVINYIGTNTLGKGIENNVYFVSAMIKVTNAECKAILLRLRNKEFSSVYSNTVQITNPVMNTVYRVSGLLTVNATGNNNDLHLLVGQLYTSSAIANGKVMEVKEMMAINLTTNGLQTLTVEECDRIFANYFDGTKSTISASRLKSVDEDGIQESTLYLPNVGELRSVSNIKDEITKIDGVWNHIKKINNDGTTILSEPIITSINVSGNLVSYPSGTIYVENVVADAGVYTTKFDIKELQLSIKSIDKLIKYNFTTGVQTLLDTTLAVINVDKKSFTHPNLTDKDMVFVDYFYDVEGTLGETTIEYLDSRHTIADTTNNKFYKWDIKSTNGVPTVELTEVL